MAKYTRLRSAYQDQQAAGLMTLRKLGAKLEGLENKRKTAEQELASLRNRQQRVEELEKNRDALLQSMSEMVPAALDDLAGEEKNRLYQMLQLKVMPSAEGYEVSGAFCTSGLTSKGLRRNISVSASVEGGASHNHVLLRNMHRRSITSWMLRQTS